MIQSEGTTEILYNLNCSMKKSSQCLNVCFYSNSKFTESLVLYLLILLFGFWNQPKINNPNVAWLPVVWKQFRISEIEIQSSSQAYGNQFFVLFNSFQNGQHVYIVNRTKLGIVANGVLSFIIEHWTFCLFETEYKMPNAGPEQFSNKFATQSFWINTHRFGLECIWHLSIFQLNAVTITFNQLLNCNSFVWFLSMLVNWIPKSMKLNRFRCFYFILDVTWCYC